ncbi:hypothetical protein BH10ACI1_BH10ACI1_33760 [soil metagenome]
MILNAGKLISHAGLITTQAGKLISQLKIIGSWTGITAAKTIAAMLQAGMMMSKTGMVVRNAISRTSKTILPPETTFTAPRRLISLIKN